MSIPLIGVIPDRDKSQKGHPILTVMEAYTQAVSRAGAVPVIVPLGIPSADLPALVGRLDGVLFTGGGDVRPQVYGSQDHPLVSGIDDDRDRIEIDLFHLLAGSEKPFLGICRGIQLINVAMGGTLYEDILDQRPGALQHDQSNNARKSRAHPVELLPGSQRCSILGKSKIAVNSLHHQGLRVLAPGLKATAFSPDGLVEGVEAQGTKFGLAVQWHPEWLQEHAPMRDLFRAFVQAAQEAA